MERTLNSADKKPATGIGLNNPNFKKDLTDLTFAEPTPQDLLTIETEFNVRERGRSKSDLDIVNLYLAEEEIKYPLLTFEEEKVLGERIQNGITLKNPRLAIQADNAKLTEDASEAFDEMVTHNLKLVIKNAVDYLGRGMRFEDLIQEGNIGLMDAAVKFDHTRGFRFSTMATWWIRQRISRAVALKGREIRIPVHRLDEMNRFKYAINLLGQKLGKTPTREEIGEYLGLNQEQLLEFYNDVRIPASLNKVVNEDDKEKNELEDFVYDEKVNIEKSQEVNECRDTVLNAISDVIKSGKQRFVILYRMGFLDGNSHTLDETGKILNLTRERVRQIESAAMAKFKSKYGVLEKLETFLEK